MQPKGCRLKNTNSQKGNVNVLFLTDYLLVYQCSQTLQTLKTSIWFSICLNFKKQLLVNVFFLTCGSWIGPSVWCLCRWMKLFTPLFSWMYPYKCKSGFILTLTPSTVLCSSSKRKSLPTSLSYDSGIWHFSSSIASNVFNRSVWAGECFSHSAVVECLWGVCWIMEGISVGF